MTERAPSPQVLDAELTAVRGELTRLDSKAATLIAVVGVMLLGESWDLTTIAALSMIVVGVVVLNLHGAH